MPTALAPGQLVDERYTLDHELYEDALGTTWEAFDRGLGRTVRLRDLTFPAGTAGAPSSSDEPEEGALLRQALQVARTAIRLHHPGAIHVYDAFIDGDRLVIVTELSYARTLDALVTQKRPLPPKRVAAIGFELIDPLAAAHAIGVVHGSIDPWAVLVPDKARSLLTGFGIAPSFTDPASVAWVEAVGTPACVAPEQARREAWGPATDVWSLGATLYVAVEGRHAFAGDTTDDTLAAILAEPPLPPARAKALWPVLESMLTKDPGQRPALDDLRRELAHLAGIALDWAAPADPGRRRRRGRRRDGDTAAAGDHDQVEVEVEVEADVPDAAPEPVPEPVQDHDWNSVVLGTDAAEPWVDWSPNASTYGPPAAPIVEAGAGEPADGATAVSDGDATESGPADGPAGPISETPEAERTAIDGAADATSAEEERVYRSTPSWPPPGQRRILVSVFCTLIAVVLVGLLVTNGHLGRSAAPIPVSAQNRPVLGTDPASVPGDWIAYHHPTLDFAISYPPGWRVREEGPVITIDDPVSGTQLRVDAHTPPGRDPEQPALDQERAFFDRHPQDYRRFQMSPATYLGHPATLWEFAYTDGTLPAHAADLGFLTKKYRFNLRFEGPDQAWQGLLPTFRGFLSSVRAPK